MWHVLMDTLPLWKVNWGEKKAAREVTPETLSDLEVSD